MNEHRSPAEGCHGPAPHFFVSCYRYPSPQCRTPIQLCSFFMRQSASVMRCMHHTQAAPPPTPPCLNQTIILCLWVTDDIYSPEIYFYHRVGRQTDICTIKRTIFQWSLCSTAILLNESNIYHSGKYIFHPTSDLKGTVVFPELPKLSVFMQWEHFTALTLHRRRQSLMITAFQFWLSASGKTNRARAGVWQLVGYSLQTQHRKKPCMRWLLFTPQKEWNGSNEALRLLPRHTRRRLIGDITGTDTKVLLIHKIL